MSIPSIVIASAGRTAVGSFNGAFGNTPAHELGAAVIKGVLERAGVEAGEVDEVILGQVLQAGEGQNPARQAAMKAGVPQEKTAWGMNQLCGSGLRAVALGMQQIATGDADIIVAGGMKMGDFKMIDTMIKDGLTDAFYGYHMGITAENVARQWQLSREEQDAFALASQNQAEAAQKAGRFADEIIPFIVNGRKGDVTVDQDEYIRHGATLDQMTKLRPAFDKEGTVTAGNASGLNDGAAATLLMSEAQASKRGIQPLARIVSWATAGVDPQVMGTGPIPASRKALARAGWAIGDVELVEANEAFAAQACAVNKDLGWDPGIVNVNGGAIAIGHPIGASGARVLNTLLFEMKRRGARKRLATLCIGGGMGVAMCVEAM
ncbi:MULTISPECIES: acetyl-CoA C-acetyltransferase [Rhizobium]|uniref:Beta-ketothiolase n=3 Tax=Rhizobium TaxID=379 RepID=A0A6P1CC91_RHITR|nr:MULTISPECIES: acetyl-CoA C-acetyltransferase [Rhizobium]AGB73641.1 acetyl-CoA acetyltransferase [Rhizobium tropici CIAT 899]AYG70552.1 acetyl-CoA C-acetyltransferase [Rhizobium sp. CCGE531]ENN83920.1 acetyl-CoA acetyltransferase [Rhizobium freirei PRF 81]MBB4245181.1 acetyl-CoA C-acetyltransferase [Rhizobium tropici]MBB5596587.1 acetyl-CoA C-acetyltransferase [Rhizobium tropici]